MKYLRIWNRGKTEIYIKIGRGGEFDTDLKEGGRIGTLELKP